MILPIPWVTFEGVAPPGQLQSTVSLPWFSVARTVKVWSPLKFLVIDNIYNSISMSTFLSIGLLISHLTLRLDFADLRVLVYKCLHGLVPSYLADELHHPAESEFWRHLRSASSHELSVPRTRLSTYGDRAFPGAAVWIWNSYPQHITSAPSLPVFCSRLKTYFFELCYP